MKVIKVYLLFFLLLTGISSYGQNLIGYYEKAIRTFMKENSKDMNFQSFTNNNTFKYLKYSDNNETRTLLFFLTADSVCKSIRLVCDLSLLNEKLKELNAIYKKNDENTWTEIKDGKIYIIELKDDQWSFNITIKPKE